MIYTPNGIILGFHETEFAVNDSSENNMTEAQLHFSVMNPNRSKKIIFSNSLQAPKSKIQLFIDIGEGEHNMFTPDDKKGYGTIICHGEFQATGWKEHETFPNKLYCDITPAGNSPVSLEALEAIRFTWTGIASTSCQGFCSIMVKFSHIKGVPDKTVLCELFKKKTDLRILQFEASPGTAAFGQTITLHWKIQKATKGYLYPGDFDIFSEEQKGASSRDVVFDKDSGSYYLNISSADCSTCRKVDLFAALPLISDLSVKNKEAKWEVHFAYLVEFSTGDSFEKVDPVGQQVLTPDISHISLRATSSEGTIQRDIHLPPVSEIISIIKETTTFKTHRIITIKWTTQLLASVTLKSWDTALYTISDVPSGEWEQAYPLTMNCQFAIYYETTKGTKGSIII